ncbi:MAG: phosphoribosylformylglycinamidine synthase subunit PurL [Bacteroidetes bacterium]|nr:phosphoribosylformylglycinamidine synthase subunit PurL [Bacteroidota bacterium]MCY4205112.1 phosphoribosylformylglycinamidine synthase subunit PurL [Bacteroidota bacterium]
MVDEILVGKKLATEHGLTEQEYAWILERLGRVPTITELGIYSVMWSEHCSYKNSIAVLKTLPREGEALLVGAGDENAGLVDIGDGLAVAFKIESHNHPSAVEPYQGAATGVGGIHRDIFTMGARPICALNSLRFGSLENNRVRYLFDGVVRGIGDYGNSFGVPTVAGEVYFDPAYEGNPLVNAMSVGIVKTDATASAIAEGAGNKVFIVGSATGRDGIHGATFASEELSEESEKKRPSVQVGDPFTEKLLLEATLEALAEGVVVGIQDMGAAGITCSSCEMSAKGNAGMRLNLDHVPVREPDMTAYEIMLSESQERMLLVCVPEKEEILQNIFKKWDLHAVCIGEVTDTGRVQVKYQGVQVADVEADHLVLGGGAPIYDRETSRPRYLDTTSLLPEVGDVQPDEIEQILEILLGAPNIASKQWVFEQYDTMVRTGTVFGPGYGDAAVVRIKGSDKALAVTTDCNGRYVFLNPRKGGQIAVAEAARNVVCAGGKPLAITNCLNFGNPYKPEVYWTFEEAVGGMGDACKVLNTPVTGGNVSFYNENPEGAVFPTPTIGMLGLIKDVEAHATQSGFRQAGDRIYLLSPQSWNFRTQIQEIGGTEYLYTYHGLTCGDAPHLDLREEQSVQSAALALINEGVIQSAHDISDGGLLVALAECVLFKDDIGADVKLSPRGEYRLDALFFGEAQSRILLSAHPSDSEQINAIVAKHPEVQLTALGTVKETPKFSVTIDDQQVMCSLVSAMKDVYFGRISEYMERAT